MSIERFTLKDTDWPEFLLHMQRYSLAKRFIADKTVLECACGEGYGTNFLAQSAKHVTGIDVSSHAVALCKEAYSRENLEFRVTDISRLPFPDAHFDAVICFEVIEHVDSDKQKRALSEIKRVLKPDGILLISTPDKLVGEARGYKNPFHIAEMSQEEFMDLLSPHFPEVSVYSQEMNMVSAMWNIRPSPKHSLQGEWIDQTVITQDQQIESKNGNDAFYYTFAVCSDGQLNLPNAHYFSSFKREPANALWNAIDELRATANGLQASLVRDREQLEISEINNTLLSKYLVTLEKENEELRNAQSDASDRLTVMEPFYYSRMARLIRRYYAIYEQPVVGPLARKARVVVRRTREMIKR